MNSKWIYLSFYSTKLRNLKYWEKLFEWPTSMSLMTYVKFRLNKGKNWGRRKCDSWFVNTIGMKYIIIIKNKFYYYFTSLLNWIRNIYIYIDTLCIL